MKTKPIKKFSETDLQKMFDAWDSREASWEWAGAPSWLKGAKQPERGTFSTLIGSTFKPDVILRETDAIRVGELKWAQNGKYNEMALSEVLHHTWMFRHDVSARAQLGPGPGVQIKPFMMVPYSPWTRASLAFLMDAGLKQGAIDFVEFTALEARSGKNILWMGDPLAVLRKTERPRFIRDIGEFDQFGHWYESASGSVFGTEQQTAEGVPTPFIVGPHVEATRRAASGFVACLGDHSGGAWEYWIED